MTVNAKSETDRIIDAMLDSVIVIDGADYIVRANQATADLLGYLKWELEGKSIHVVILGEVRHATGKRTETAYLKKDGTSLPMLFSATEMHTDSGMSPGWVLVAHNSADAKQAQEALIRKTQALECSNKELDQFAYVVSHDLKAPLRAIANLSQWIEEDLCDKIPPDTRKQMDLLRGRVQRMEGLINGVLEYSRAGRVAVHVDITDTQALLNDIIDGLPLPAGYTITTISAMPRFSTARTQLSQVFGNLLSNAIKYRSRDEGHATVSVTDEGDFYEFTIQDDGVGISPEYHDKVFVIFQTLAARDKVDSTGIGLTLVKKIVESMGGCITLESQEGHGATFRFTWPKSIKEGAIT